MAPQGLDLITPDEPAKQLPVELPVGMFRPAGDH
jgi:hypothetical protein